ncbi:hypothetical protein tb265_00970 [Gemmatimonadetes bacterium T265]|nr:hypothetical protein tb265_00970 [Gemmatimonadetes bacterium T265]
MSERQERRAGEEARERRPADVGVGVLQAVAVAGAALWFRDAVERYAIAAVLASTAALVVGWRRAERGPSPAHQRELDRGTAVLFTLAALLVAAPAVRLAKTPATPAPNAAVMAVARAVAPTLRALEQTARAAVVRTVDARLSTRQRFAALAALADSGDAHRGERAVAVFDGAGAPMAWAGTWRVRPDSLDVRRRTGAAGSPFYVVLYATAAADDGMSGLGGARRAVAATVLHAEPPADALARALDAGVLEDSGLRGLEVRALGPDGPPVIGPGWWTMPVPGSPERLALREVPPAPAAVRAQLLEAARRVAAPGLTLMTVLAAVALWRLGTGTRFARATASAAALLLPLAVLALTPLGALSNATRLFDPSVYFSPLGGALTSTLGALAATGAVAVVAVATAWRGTEAAGAARWNGPFRVVGGAVAAALVVAVGARLVRALARGVSPPPSGSTVGLFVVWEGAFCLVIAALLLWAVVLARPALERLGRGREPRYPSVAAITGPLLAAVVALVGVTQWTAADGWPTWYPPLWLAPALLVIVSRAGRAVVPAAIAVAGLGASTLVWGATTERQVALAERDVRALAVPDADALALLARFGRSLAMDPAPEGDAAGATLLQRYATSPLAAAGYPVTLARWDAASTRETSPLERVGFVLWGVDSAATVSAVRAAAATKAPVTRAIAADPGAATLLAVPQRDGRVATVTLFPRAQFATVDPLGVLLGGGRVRAEEPPYLLSLLRQGGARPRTGAVATLVPQPPPEPEAVLRWTRSESVAHADARVLLPDGPASAHVEIALGTLNVLAQRVALLVFANLVGVGLLWWLPSLDASRWPRPRRGWRSWTGSYRTRLTAALFAFFAVPTLAFAAWTFVQLQRDQRESRALLVRETLRAAVADGALAGNPRALAEVAARLGAPLLAYEHGVLTATSEPALLPLAPFGRLIPSAQMLSVGAGDEVTATFDAPPALGGALIGFRAALAGDGRRVILAAPARSDDFTRDEQSRDLGFLVLLAATTGALAALWLSGVAARQLARPVGSLRRAAIALARGHPGPVEPGRGESARGELVPGASGRLTPARGVHHVEAALEREPPAEFRPVFGAFRHMAVELDASHVALEAARQRTAAVLRDVASGVIAVDAAACVTVANPRAAALLGRPLVVGQPLAAVVPAEVADPVGVFLADAAAGGGPRRRALGRDVAFDVTVRGRQLRARLTTLGAARAAAGDGADVADAAPGAVLTLDDVTDLAHAQRVLAWGEMARQVAHEIKNPLTPIRLGVQLLRRAYHDGRGSNFAELLALTTDRVLAEIDRLDEIARAFSRYGTAPTQAAPPEPTDVAAIARDVVALERLGGGDVRWELGAPPRASAWARDGELREVVLNLLENARLAGAEHVGVTVACEDGNGAGPAVALTVRDDGHGIAADVLPRIFDPHFSTRTSGSGLGLAIARRLVDGWGGRIVAESVVGQGTTVTVTLRATDVPS